MVDVLLSIAFAVSFVFLVVMSLRILFWEDRFVEEGPDRIVDID